MDANQFLDRLAQVEMKVFDIQVTANQVIERHSSVLERVADRIEQALEFQREVIKLQKEMLPVGLVMKLFTFFSVLVMGILGTVLGVKWLFLDMFK